VASDLAATERKLRSAAVAAYLAGGDEQQWLAFMGAGDLAEQSSRMTSRASAWPTRVRSLSGSHS
jgi:hypothetical protein